MNLPINILLIPLLPLVSFLVLGIFGRRYLSSVSGIVGTTFMFISCILAIQTATDYFFHSGMIEGAYRSLIPFQMTWLPFSQDVSINVGVLLDPISVMMLVVVTVVSLMVHVYSLGYMKGEERSGVSVTAVVSG